MYTIEKIRANSYNPNSELNLEAARNIYLEKIYTMPVVVLFTCRIFMK
jgi:hypothetical protein